MTSIEKVVQVEVAYATPERQLIKTVTLPKGATVRQAAEYSGIVEDFPEINLATAKFGIFSKAVPKPDQQEVSEGDRVEIYRPLLIDPKQARANRAKKAAKKAD